MCSSRAQCLLQHLVLTRRSARVLGEPGKESSEDKDWTSSSEIVNKGLTVTWGSFSAFHEHLRWGQPLPPVVVKEICCSVHPLNLGTSLVTGWVCVWVWLCIGFGLWQFSCLNESVKKNGSAWAPHTLGTTIFLVYYLIVIFYYQSLFVNSLKWGTILSLFFHSVTGNSLTILSC